ncbi:MAG: hypothetical protein ACQR33_04605 [Candidatus Saccharibacteria bacterium]
MPTFRPPARQIVEAGFSDRITVTGADSECSSDQAQRAMKSWKDSGKFTIFCIGGFDILHPNHLLGLTRCRTIGAMCMLGIENATTEKEITTVHMAAVSDVRMMVSIDTNAAIAKGKSRNPVKGGGPKPTLDWLNRARMVAAQSMAAPNSELRVPLADFITCHGQGNCAQHTEENPCSTRRHRPNIVALQPDALVIRDDLTSIPLLAQEQAAGNLPHTTIALFSEKCDAFEDLFLGGAIGATAISNRIRS